MTELPSGVSRIVAASFRLLLLGTPLIVLSRRFSLFFT